MSIAYIEKHKIFKLDTPDSTYAFRVSPTGFLLHLYYGAYVPDSDLSYLGDMIGVNEVSPKVDSELENRLSLDSAYLEYPCDSPDFLSLCPIRSPFVRSTMEFACSAQSASSSLVSGKCEHIRHRRTPPHFDQKRERGCPCGDLFLFLPM